MPNPDSYKNLLDRLSSVDVNLTLNSADYQISRRLVEEHGRSQNTHEGRRALQAIQTQFLREHSMQHDTQSSSPHAIQPSETRLSSSSSSAARSSIVTQPRSGMTGETVSFKNENEYYSYLFFRGNCSEQEWTNLISDLEEAQKRHDVVFAMRTNDILSLKTKHRNDFPALLCCVKDMRDNKKYFYQFVHNILGKDTISDSIEKLIGNEDYPKAQASFARRPR